MISLPRRWRIMAPLAHASAAITEGLARRQLERRGMQVQERRLAGATVVTYRIPGPPQVPPVALIHGLGSSAMTWSQLMALLRGRAEIHALDLPGFGLAALASDAEPFSLGRHVEVVRTFLQEVVGRPAVIVGNSMGGWLTLRIGRDHPSLATALLTLNPAGILLDPDSWHSTRLLFQPSDFAAVRRFYRALFGRVPLPIYLSQPETMRRLWRRSVQGVLEQADAADFLDPETLKQIRLPTTIVWGESDRLLPAGSLRLLQEHLADARLVLLPRCGHLPQIERPRQVADEIVRLLEAAPAALDAHSDPSPLVV